MDTNKHIILRQKAENLIKQRAEKGAEMPTEAEIRKFLHELEVYQIELELQNEELIQAKANEELVAEKYLNLYDFAPTGYYTLSTEGDIVGLNIAGAAFLGNNRKKLINNRFSLYISDDSKPAFNQFFENVFKSDSREVCEVTLSIPDKPPTYAYLTGVATENKVQCLLTLADITKRKEAEDALIESHELLQSLIENVPIRVFWKDHDLRYLGCNTVFARDAGMSGPEDMVGKDDFQLGWRDQAEAYRADDKLVIDSGKPRIGYVEPQSTPDGNTIWLRTSKVPLLDTKRKVIGVLGIYDDVTESRQHEIDIIEDKRRLKAILDASPFPIAVVDTNDELISYWSKSAIKLFGHQPKTTTEWYKLAYPDPDYRQEIFERWQPFLEIARASAEAVKTGENRIVCKDGSVKTCEVFAQFIPDFLIVTFNDITDKKAAEKEAIKISQHYKALIEKAPDGIVLLNSEGNFKYISPAAKKMFGYIPTDEVYGNPAKLTHPDDLQMVVSELGKVFEDPNYVPTLEYRFVDKQGNWHWVETTFSNLLANPNVESIVLNFRDITERKQNEEELIESEERYRNLLNNVSAGIGYYDLEGNVMLFNKLAASNMNGKPEDFIGKSIFELYGEDLGKFYFDRLQSAAEATDFLEFEDEVTLPDRTMWFISRYSSIYNAEGAVIGVQIVSHDITKPKLAEKALQESEARFKALHDASFGGIAIHDKGLILDCNRGLSEMTGYETTELVGMDGLLLIAEEYREMVMGTILAEYEKPYESIGIRKNGEKYNLRIAAKMIPYKGQHVRVVEFRDITEQKQAAKKLEKSEALYRMLAANSIDTIWQMDLRLKFTYVSPNIKEIMGYTQKEFIGTRLSKYSSRKEFFNMARHALKSAKNYKTLNHIVFEANLIRKNGDEFPVEIIGRTVLDKNGIPVSFQGSTRDITERKIAENEIYQSETRFRELVKNITSGVVVYKVINDGMSGADYIFKDCNKASSLIEGLSREEMIGRSLLELRPNIDKYGLVPVLHETWKTGKTNFFSAKKYTDDKFESFYENRIYRLPNGEVVAVYDDVTERENAIIEITESRKRFDLAMKASRDGLFDWNLITNQIYYSPGWKNMLGYKDDELPNDFSVWEKLTEPGLVERSWEMQQEMINKQRDRFELEFKMKHKDGHWVDILSRAEAVFDENGKAIRMVGTHVDITERKLAEEEISRLKNAVDNSFLGVAMAAMDGTNFYMNKAAYELFGYDSEKDFLQISHPGVGWAEPEKFDLNLQHLKSKGSWKGDMIAMRKDGSYFDCFISANIIKNMYGEPQHIIAYYLDITDRKQAEEAVKKLNDELEQKVMERTENLENKNTELSRMNRLFVGRELRMAELKQMIKEMEEKLTNK